MAKTALYNMEGAAIGEIELSDAIFASSINEAAMHLVVRSYLAAQRQGTQSAKTRTEVRGGGRKIYRQKGTGSARQGSTRAPQWYHGGIAFAPKPREYGFSINKKVKRIAMQSALSAKVAENELVVVDSIATGEFKTKKIVEMLKALGANKKALIVLPEVDKFVVKSASNIEGVKTAIPGTLNVYDILKYDMFIVAKDAVKVIEEVYA